VIPSKVYNLFWYATNQRCYFPLLS